LTSRILFAGNPNCGKTSLFNALTGARQKVGNYPGVTVERRAAELDLDGERVEVLDLPGTYSLLAYSPEERVAVDQLLTDERDLVVVVVDATNLYRSMVLFAQLLSIPRPMLLCVNMMDEAEASGQLLDLALLEKLLGVPVVTTVAHRGQGIDELRQKLSQLSRKASLPRVEVRNDALDQALLPLSAHLAGRCPEFRRRFNALSLLLAESPPSDDPELSFLWERARAQLVSATGSDVALYVTHLHFGFVDGLLREVVKKPPRENARDFSNRLDGFLVHPWLGGPLFLLIMYGIFWSTFELGAFPMSWLESAFGWLGEQLFSWLGGRSSELASLLVDGVLAGVGGVLVFLPNIVILFFGLSFLEDTGYMARVAFIMDRVMHRFGLHGRSFVPMLTGFGCTVPAMLATRTIESRRDRLTTLFVLPLVSCGARLPIWLLLVPAFFPKELQAPAMFGIYATGLTLALGLALLLRRTVFRGDDAPFVMELPPYRMPTLRAALLLAYERACSYLRKAGTMILAVSIVMWAITSYPKAELSPAEANSPHEIVAARQLESSVAGHLGRLIEPALLPLGLDWRIGVSLVGAFAAKEVFVAQLGVVSALTEPSASDSQLSLSQFLTRTYTPASGIALMLFLLIATPCMATVAVVRRESNSRLFATLQFLGLTVLGYLLATLVYQIAQFLQ